MKKQSRETRIPGRLREVGFSLIEVTMALGITAMVLVPLLAILPHSMKNMREAIDVSVSARILEEIASEAQLMKFDDLKNLEDRDGGIRHYDVQGNQIIGGGGNSIVYSARINVPSNSTRGGVTLPRSSLDTDKFARRIVIDVAVTRGLDFDWDDPRNFRDMQSFVTIVAKLRDDTSV